MKRLFIITFIFLIVFNSESQRKRNLSNNTSVNKSDISISALRLRNVGPAFLSGRIADIAIHLTMIMYGMLQLDQVESGKLKTQGQLTLQYLIMKQLTQQVVLQ